MKSSGNLAATEAYTKRRRYARECTGTPQRAGGRGVGLPQATSKPHERKAGDAKYHVQVHNLDLTSPASRRLRTGALYHTEPCFPPPPAVPYHHDPTRPARLRLRALRRRRAHRHPRALATPPGLLRSRLLGRLPTVLRRLNVLPQVTPWTPKIPPLPIPTTATTPSTSSTDLAKNYSPEAPSHVRGTAPINAK